MCIRKRQLARTQSVTWRVCFVSIKSDEEETKKPLAQKDKISCSNIQAKVFLRSPRSFLVGLGMFLLCSLMVRPHTECSAWWHIPGWTESWKDMAGKDPSGQGSSAIQKSGKEHQYVLPGGGQESVAFLWGKTNIFLTILSPGIFRNIILEKLSTLMHFFSRVNNPKGFVPLQCVCMRNVCTQTASVKKPLQDLAYKEIVKIHW